MDVKVVIGSNYGDECKGLVAGCLGEMNPGRILTINYNGCQQRAHTYKDHIFHCTGVNDANGGDTFYHRQFVIDPIALWLTRERVIIDPRCRIILPCDVMKNRNLEKSRGDKRHGSCGMGLFACVTRSKTNPIFASDLLKDPYTLYNMIKKVNQHYPYNEDDGLYTIGHFMQAAEYLVRECEFITFEDLMKEERYDHLIYEGGQGLLLDQLNRGDFPHLTPSSVSAENIHKDIEKLNAPTELFYVSRTYMTRHGAGPMEAECAKEDINPDIIDTTNQANPWQGALRFGRIYLPSLYKRVQADAARYNLDKKINLVFTHTNYTDGKLETTDGRIDIQKPDFASHLYTSSRKDYMEKIA